MAGWAQTSAKKCANGAGRDVDIQCSILTKVLEFRMSGRLRLEVQTSVYIPRYLGR